MLILSTWTHVYSSLVIISWLYTIVTSQANGLVHTTSTCVLTPWPVYSASKTAFIGSFLPSERSLNRKKRKRSIFAENGEIVSQRASPSYVPCMENVKGICMGLKLRMESLSEALSENANTIHQRIRKSSFLKRTWERMQAMKETMKSLSIKQQIALALLGKLIYILVLPGYHILLPYQLLPVNSGLGVDIGLDTIVSLFSGYMLIKSMCPPVPPLKLETRDKMILPLVTAGLMGSFYLSGYAAQMVDGLMLILSALDVPVSVGFQRSMRILLGHLSWVVTGAKILNYAVPLAQLNSKWLSMNPHDIWLYKALAGYFLSCTVYNVSDVIFTAAERLLKGSDLYHADRFDEMEANPLMEPTYIIPTIITAIGPCITAPWWEELLYRIFVYKTLNSKLPNYVATTLSAFMFSVHHMNVRSTLQLFSLGVLWSLIEQGTNNLFISIAIHSLWNTRIMLGTLLGV